MAISPQTPVFAHPEAHLIPVGGHLRQLQPTPPSRMFLIKQSLDAYLAKNPGSPVYDASQGDGGASLPGVPAAILARAAELQIRQGTAYDMPFGTAAYRRAVAEQYWQLDPSLGFGPQNVVATVGGRDALSKAYDSMLHLGHGRQGDAIIVSRVPWVSYNWGPYALGANVLLAPGYPEDGWGYTPESIRACVDFAAQSGRKIAGLLITNPDNPTGRTISTAEQAALARAALEAGVAFVLFDWIYHYVTDEQPADLNELLGHFTPAERKRLMFLDGITKSLGGSNIRNCHLIASEEVVKFVVARASHGVIPPFYSMAVAMAAYEMGYAEASRTIVEPANASRVVLKAFLEAHGYKFILGKGYYAFIYVGPWLEAGNFADTIPFGEFLARQHGLAVVPGAFNSPDGAAWIRFSYALPPETTLAAATRLHHALRSI